MSSEIITRRTATSVTWNPDLLLPTLTQAQYEEARESFFKKFRKAILTDLKSSTALTNEVVSRWLDTFDPDGEIGIETKVTGSSRAKLIIDKELGIDFQYVHSA